MIRFLTIILGFISTAVLADVTYLTCPWKDYDLFWDEKSQQLIDKNDENRFNSLDSKPSWTVMFTLVTNDEAIEITTTWITIVFGTKFDWDPSPNRWDSWGVWISNYTDLEWDVNSDGRYYRGVDKKFVRESYNSPWKDGVWYLDRTTLDLLKRIEYPDRKYDYPSPSYKTEDDFTCRISSKEEQQGLLRQVRKIEQSIEKRKRELQESLEKREREEQADRESKYKI